MIPFTLLHFPVQEFVFVVFISLLIAESEFDLEVQDYLLF